MADRDQRERGPVVNPLPPEVEGDEEQVVFEPDPNYTGAGEGDGSSNPEYVEHRRRLAARELERTMARNRAAAAGGAGGPEVGGDLRGPETLSKGDILRRAQAEAGGAAPPNAGTTAPTSGVVPESLSSETVTRSGGGLSSGTTPVAKVAGSSTSGNGGSSGASGASRG